MSQGIIKLVFMPGLDGTGISFDTWLNCKVSCLCVSLCIIKLEFYFEKAISR